MIEENGHVWRLTVGLHVGRCERCGVKYGEYLTLRRASELEPDNQELKDGLKCKGDEKAINNDNRKI